MLIFYCLITFILEEASPKTGADIVPKAHCDVRKISQIGGAELCDF
jgi:hypothetical protein